MPAAQGRQAGEPWASATVPGAQATQVRASLAPRALEAVPGAQGVHAMLASDSLYFPGEQGAQSVVRLRPPARTPYVPGGQKVSQAPEPGRGCRVPGVHT